MNIKLLLGIMITLTGSLLYVVMSLLVKTIGNHLSVEQIIFLQSFFGLCCATYLIKQKHYSWHTLWTQQKPSHVLRITMSLAAVYTLIYGLQYVSVFNALVVLNTAPLIIPLLRRLCFAKPIQRWIYPAILLAFSGIVLILKPDRQLLQGPILVIFISMLCMAFSLLILERNRNINPNLSIFYYFLYSSLATALVLIIKQQLFSLSLHYLPLASIIGVLFFLVQFSVICAAQYISSQLIALLFYIEIIMALIVSVVFEGLQLNHQLIVGTALVLFGGWLAMVLENKPQRYTQK